MNSLSNKIHRLLLSIPLFTIISCNDEIVYPEEGLPNDHPSFSPLIKNNPGNPGSH